MQHHDEKKEIIDHTTIVYKSNKKAQAEIASENDKISQLRSLEKKQKSENDALEAKITSFEKKESEAA